MQISRQLKQAELIEFAALYIQSEARQDIAFHPTGVRVWPPAARESPYLVEPGRGARDHLDAMNTRQVEGEKKGFKLGRR